MSSKYIPSGASLEVFDRISTNFTYHPPKDDQPERYITIREKAKELAHVLTQNCPPSRELSLALTKLEEVAFWANASIARVE